MCVKKQKMNPFILNIVKINLRWAILVGEWSKEAQRVIKFKYSHNWSKWVFSSAGKLKASSALGSSHGAVSAQAGSCGHAGLWTGFPYRRSVRAGLYPQPLSGNRKYNCVLQAWLNSAPGHLYPYFLLDRYRWLGRRDMDSVTRREPQYTGVCVSVCVSACVMNASPL